MGRTRRVPLSISSDADSSDSSSDEDEHILTIDLNSSINARNVLVTKRTILSNFHGIPDHNREDLRIVASILSTSDDDYNPTLQVVTSSRTEEAEGPEENSIERWL